MNFYLKKAADILKILFIAVCLSGCASNLYTPSVNNDDVEAVSNAALYSQSEITPDVQSGIYVTGEEPKTVSFDYEVNEEKNTVLRYSLSCATPDSGSKICSDGVLDIEYKDTGDGASYQAVIRCALFEDEERVSDVYTFVYIHAAEDRFYLPVVSIVSDKNNFYSNQTGILVEGVMRQNGNPPGWQPWYDNANYYGRGMEWERPVALTVFDESGNLGLSQNCGVRVSGGYTRVNRQKSLRLYARRDYTPDTGVFAYSFWSGNRGSHTGTPASFSDTVLLRGGSNNEGNALFTTPCLLMLLEGTDLDSPAITPVVEFINGRYYGIVTQLEDYDEDFFLVNYGVEKEDLTTMKGTVGELLVPAGWHVDDGPEEEQSEFYDMLKYIIRSDMTDPECYARACEMIDIQNFIEYMAFEGYIGNTDWPDNNLRAWRYNKNGYDPDGEGVFDGRWRFLTKDLDLSFGYGSFNANANPYTFLQGGSNLLLKNIYNSLMKNSEFSDLFYNYMCTLAEAVVTPERCEKIFDLMQVYTGKEVAYSISAVGVGGGSRTNWNNGFDVLRDYSISRSAAVLRHTKSASKQNYGEITVNYSAGGVVELGWYAIESSQPRSYLQQSRVPLEIYPDDGYEIAEVTYSGCHIDGDGYLIADGNTASVNVTFTAVEAESDSGVVINEVMFRGTEIEWVELYNSTDEDIILSGWSLGKSTNIKKAKSFADTVIESKGYALICCTDNANTAGIKGLRVILSLGSGDTLYLYNSAGETVDTLELESPSKTVHIGRIPDGGDAVQLSLSEATPGSSNAMESDKGAFGSDKFVPYMLAWGRVYDIDDYFYEKDGVTYANNSALMELLSGDNRGVELYRYIKKQPADMTLDDLVEGSSIMDGASVRFLPELKSVIVG
ncbi:MAG: CotH kinase family protein [Eubacteriales bacterium]